METTLLRELQRIQRLSVSELQAEWSRLYGGEPCRSRNRTYLVKRLCWKLQELRHGGLTDHARARIGELAPRSFTRDRTPREALDAATVANQQKADPVSGPKRDPRLPTPGSVIRKVYKGSELRVTIRDDGVEFEGRVFSSLTAVAKHVTGCRSINGRLFWNLVARKRKS